MLKKISISVFVVITAISMNVFANIYTLSIHDGKFWPQDMTVQYGDIVYWENNDNTVHSVTATDGSFDSGPLEPGDSFYHEFIGFSDYHYYSMNIPDENGYISVTFSEGIAYLQSESSTVPATGGEIAFTIGMDNLTCGIVQYDLWTKIQGPDGMFYGPLIFQDDARNFECGLTTRSRTLQIPENAPPGIYYYQMYIGSYPGHVYSQNFFSFVKEGSARDELSGKITFKKEDNFTLPTTNGGEGCIEEFISDKIDKSKFSASPNPFNPETRIKLELADDAYVSLKIYNISGREVSDLVNGSLKEGRYEFSFNASGLATGIYFVNLIIDGKAQTYKLMFTK